MSYDRLLLYNNALMDLGERQLASLTEDREPRYLLDTVWETGAVEWCLEQGQWSFAMRSIKLTYSPSVEPQWGYRRAFNKPDDWVRTAGLCSDEYFRQPILSLFDEANFWFCDLDTIYVRYVSDDEGYGANMGKWSPSFGRLVSSKLSAEIVSKITSDRERVKEIEESLIAHLRDARAKDALNQPTVFAPPGTWTVSRRGRRTRWDRGSSGGNLIG